MNEMSALSKVEPTALAIPKVDSSLLPAKVSKRLWITTWAILGFIRFVLGTSCMIDYNLRRKGKRALAISFFLSQWRFHSTPRTIMERHFAWAKCYFGLESACWMGLVAAYQHTALVYATMLAIPLIAHCYQRLELAGSRYRVLALKSLP